MAVAVALAALWLVPLPPDAGARYGGADGPMAGNGPPLPPSTAALLLLFAHRRRPPAVMMARSRSPPSSAAERARGARYQ